MVSQNAGDVQTMAYHTTTKRQKADGTARYRCTVAVKSGGKFLHRESRTFGKQAMAESWGKRRVAELEQNGVPDQNDVNVMTVGELVRRYINDPNLGGKAGRTKKYVLELLSDSDISLSMLSKLETVDVIEHCRGRSASGAGPSTVSHDVSYLASVLCAAKPIFGIEYTKNPAQDARPMLLQMGLVGKSQRRNRRPVANELERLETGLKERSEHRGAKIPFVDILNFSILSCMRISEVCRLRWEDVSEKNKAVIVRDRKDPRKKTGNHMIVALLGDAWTILQRQPKTGELVFPYNSRSVTAGFQQVRNQLGIEDLQYRDLRREGASRLFEAGFSIEEVAQVTGHRSLTVLWLVYRELYPEPLHEKFASLKKK